MQRQIKKCSKRELKILGDFWTLEIIQSLAESPLRFSQIERKVEGINPATLTNRLKKLEGQGLISRQEETLDKISVVYQLTKKGVGVLPILKEIFKFAQSYL